MRTGYSNGCPCGCSDRELNRPAPEAVCIHGMTAADAHVCSAPWTATDMTGATDEALADRIRTIEDAPAAPESWHRLRYAVADALEPIMWEREQAQHGIPDEPSFRYAWSAGSVPDRLRMADAVLAAALTIAGDPS